MDGSIRKRGESSWELTIDLGRDEHGNRRRKFVHVKGRKADASKRLRDLLLAHDRNLPIDSPKVTVAQWFSRWQVEYVVPNTRQMTRERYERVVKRHIVPCLGNIELQKLAPRDIQGLEARLSESGMPAAGVELVHNVISGALKYAVRMEVLWRNPAQAVTPPRLVRKEVEPPEIDRVRQVLDMASAEEHPLFACLRLIAYTGVRRGEALGLRWPDVNLEEGTIAIVQTLGRSVEKGLIFQPPKTNSGRRTIDLDPGTVSVLRGHKGKQLLQKLQAEGAFNDEGLVFADPLGEPLNPMAVTRAWKALAKRVGIEDARVHDLRHFHASVMLQQGQSLTLVSKRLGHSSMATTGDIYAHILPHWQKEAASAFAKAMERG